jgi:hypothetical protein
MCGNRQLSTPRRRMWLDHGVPDLESMSREELIAHARRQDAQITRLATELAEVTEKLAKLEHLISRNSSNSSFPFVQGRRPGWHSPAPEAAPGSARRAEEGKAAGRCGYRVGLERHDHPSMVAEFCRAPRRFEQQR